MSNPDAYRFERPRGNLPAKPGLRRYANEVKRFVKPMARAIAFRAVTARSRGGRSVIGLTRALAGHFRLAGRQRGRVAWRPQMDAAATGQRRRFLDGHFAPSTSLTCWIPVRVLYSPSGGSFADFDFGSATAPPHNLCPGKDRPLENRWSVLQFQSLKMLPWSAGADGADPA